MPSTAVPPKPNREFRAAWIATVGNIDWPSTNNLTSAQQKAELLAMFDRAVELNLNTIILQVRPSCDALYASSIEPWSEYLTGTMGKAPEPLYDPLAFAVDQAHKRGLELHAWFNPYRARVSSARSPISATHISRTRPQLVRTYGKQLWLDPGERAVQDYSLSVVMDVVRRYDIDGAHFDDYFYPYKEKDGAGDDLDFPDEASWRRFGAANGLSREDWRRENVNSFVERVYRSIKAAKPWVKFGISPFGIWRPGNPEQIKGFDAYAKLYADSRKWLANGWLDYFAPQLYWSIDAPEQSFPVLLKWWAQQNAKDRLLAPGLDATKTRRQWPPAEIVNQVRLSRKQRGVEGEIFWNMRSLMRNAALGGALTKDVYSETALLPAMPWLHQDPPPKPLLTIPGARRPLRLEWTASGTGVPVAWWVLQTREGRQWSTTILAGSKSSFEWTGRLPEVIALSAVDRYGNQGQAAVRALRAQN